jgi:phosphotriesterase-related protein
MAVQTVTGQISENALGRTLMHEHLLAGMPGWQTDTITPGPSRNDIIARCVDFVAEMKDAGITSIVDPIPSDLGRDVEIMAEVAARTAFNVICATGLYNEAEGASSYWTLRMKTDPNAVDHLADVMATELSSGIGETGIRAGIIKLATNRPAITAYEDMVFRAAAKAAVATGAVITTHTDAILGPEQVALLASGGVEPHRIIVGHSCGTDDHAYHTSIIDTGAYIGFDRFGLTAVISDEARVQSLARLVEAGHGEKIVVSHDCVCCWRGQPLAGKALASNQALRPSHFGRTIVPMLKQAGLGDSDIDALLIDNPRAFFTS